MSMRRLGVERIELWQLHRIDPAVPRDEQFGVMAAMQKEGLIRHLGLSEVGLDEIEAARKHFVVATVQNEYNLVTRKSEAVLDYCTTHDIGFIPWFPLAAGSLAKPGSVLSRIAETRGATPAQVALAWVLKRSPVMLPIPGTANPDHLAQNVAAAASACRTRSSRRSMTWVATWHDSRGARLRRCSVGLDSLSAAGLAPSVG